MSEQTLMKAVDPFFSTKEVGKGTGLGLSMVHGLALQLKGSLRLTSAVGHGTLRSCGSPKLSGRYPLMTLSSRVALASLGRYGS